MFRREREGTSGTNEPPGFRPGGILCPEAQEGDPSRAGGFAELRRQRLVSWEPLQPGSAGQSRAGMKPQTERVADLHGVLLNTALNTKPHRQSEMPGRQAKNPLESYRLNHS